MMLTRSIGNSKHRTALTIFPLLLLILSPLEASALGLGVSPGAVEFKDVLRSGYAEKTVTLSTSSDEPITCQISAEGPFRNWLRYLPGETFTIPPRSQVKLKIIVEPPEDIPNGLYDGYVVIAIIPKGREGGGMGSAISAAVSVKSSIQISDVERKHFFLIGQPTAVDSEEGKPINFYFSFENDGNVRLYPKIHIDILSEDKTTVLKSIDYSEKILLPTARTDILITSQNDLPIGKYWGKATVYLDNSVLYEYMLSFQVLERGSLRIKGNLVKVELNKIWVYSGEMVEINATFVNEGVLSTPAVFNGKALLGDGIEALVKSDEVEVSPGETVELASYFTPKKAGRYTIIGKVQYSKKITDEKSTILNVRDISEKPVTATTAVKETSGSGIDMVQAAGALLVFSIIVGFVLWRMKKSSRKRGNIKEEDKLSG